MTSNDTILGGRVTLAQPQTGYRAAIDPVLLAACCPARAGQTVLDAGCGVGTAGLCVAARTSCGADGVELQPGMAQLARANREANGVAGRVFTASIMQPPGEVTGTKYDHVICNPPYLTAGYGSGTPTPETHEGDAKLTDWVTFCAKRVSAMSVQLGAIAIFPFWPRAGEAATRVIVGGIKGRRTPSCLLAGLVLHESGGRYTQQAQAILSDAEPILLWPA
jgi:tRNA1(Val) A37 N6-methylase TrmN6